jgi:hypothetical protein
MREQEKRVLDLAKRYGDKMREAKEVDPDLTPTQPEDREQKERAAESLYSDATDILENLEDAIEELLHDEFIPLTEAQRTIYRRYAEKIDEYVSRLPRLRNAYYGLAASKNTQEDFDRWDSEIIAEENTIVAIVREMDKIQNEMNSM